MRVFLADDHVLVRESVRGLLEATGEIRVVGEAADGETVVARAATESWDVLVLDLELQGLSGFEVLRRVLELRPAQRVLIMSMHPDGPVAARVVRAGAAGYLSKGRPAAELVRALKEIHAGRPFLSPAVEGELLSAGPGELSDRETQVLTLLAGGKSPSEIAHALALRASTVSTHLANIKAKISARSLADLVQYALKNGLGGR